MKTFALVATLFVASTAVASEDLDRYSYFQDQGVFKIDVSNEAANALVAEGIASDNPVIVDMTIRALGDYASRVAHNLPNLHGRLPERTFHDVPGLKDFLIDRWRTEHANSGYDAVGAIRAATEEVWRSSTTPDTSTHGDDRARAAIAGLAAALGFDDPQDASPDEVFLALRNRRPSWKRIPGLLCALWPNDPDVLRLIWDYRATDQSPTIDLTVLGLMNTGRFATPAVDEFRLTQLARPGDEHASVAKMFAAKGLRISRPREALPLLITAALEHPERSDDILPTIAAYTDQQLAPYSTDLAPLLSRRTRDPMGAAAEAMDRLRAVVQQAGTVSE